MPGPLKKEPKRLRRQERSIRILNAGFRRRYCPESFWDRSDILPLLSGFDRLRLSGGGKGKGAGRRGKGIPERQGLYSQRGDADQGG